MWLLFSDKKVISVQTKDCDNNQVCDNNGIKKIEIISCVTSWVNKLKPRLK